VAEVGEGLLELLAHQLARLEVGLAASRDEDGLVRLRVARLRLRLRLLDLEHAEVAELDADLGVGLDHQLPQRLDHRVHPRLALVDRLALDLGDASRHVLLRQRGDTLGSHRWSGLVGVWWDAAQCATFASSPTPGRPPARPRPQTSFSQRSGSPLAGALPTRAAPDPMTLTVVRPVGSDSLT